MKASLLPGSKPARKTSTNSSKLQVNFKIKKDEIKYSQIGLGWAKRKIAVNLNTTVTFSFPDDDTFHVDFVTKVMSKKEKFSLSKVTKHKSKGLSNLQEIKV